MSPLDPAELSRAGKRRLLAGEARPLFLCDWLRTLMIHFAVPSKALEDARTVCAHAIDGKGKGRLSCSVEFAGRCMFRPSEVRSLTAFLMERYTAFTERRGRLGLFRIWHPPWPQQQAARIQLPELSLLVGAGSWLHDAQMVGANYSPGLTDVWIGRPHRLRVGRPMLELGILGGRAARHRIRAESTRKPQLATECRSPGAYRALSSQKTYGAVVGHG